MFLPLFSLLCSLSGCPLPLFSSHGILYVVCGRHRAFVNARLQRPYGVCNICSLTGCTRQKFLKENKQRNHDYRGWQRSKPALLRGERIVFGRDTCLCPRICSLPGCQAPVAVDLNGVKFEHFSKTYAYQVYRSSQSVKQKLSAGRVYGQQYGGVLYLLSASDQVEYRSIESCVLELWRQFNGSGRRALRRRVFPLLVEFMYAIVAVRFFRNTLLIAALCLKRMAT